MTSDTDIALTVNQLSLWYGERQALQAISAAGAEKQDYRADWPLRLWQIDAAALF